MNTHKICFCEEIRKISAFFSDEKSALSVAMENSNQTAQMCRLL